jgi:hypothetical protein
MKKFLTIVILILSLSVSFGQKNQCTTFHDFDISANTLSDAREIVTDKIVFSGDNTLDIKKSKPTLDSLVWFLNRHPKAIISIILLKAQSITSKDTQFGQKQCNQVVDFLSKKGIHSKRVISAVSYIRENSTEQTIIKTRIRLLSQDFSDSAGK